MVVFQTPCLFVLLARLKKMTSKITYQNSLGMPLYKTEVTTQEPETCCSGLREWNSLVTLAWLKKTCKLFKD